MTTTTDTTMEAVASEAYEAMEQRTRDDGTPYVAVKDDAPEWVRESWRWPCRRRWTSGAPGETITPG